MIHGDVFRSPQFLNVFSALIGAGAQLFFTILILLSAVVLGAFKATRRGALLTAGIVIFALCGCMGGLISGRLFKQLKGKNWAWNTLLTASVFPVPLGLVFTIVNAIAWKSNSTAALPFTTILVRTIISTTLIFPNTFSSLVNSCNYFICSSSINCGWCNHWKKYYR
jgi:transmembrane 9 superfamily protein 2/4